MMWLEYRQAGEERPDEKGCVKEQMLSAERDGESRRGRQQEGTRSDFPYEKPAKGCGW